MALLKFEKTVTIGGQKYRVVDIGNIRIMAEDLREYEGVSHYIIRDNTYYYGGWSMYSDVNSMITAEETRGWKLIDTACFDSIFTTLGGNNETNAKKLLAYGGSTWPGTDDFGLGFINNGEYHGPNKISKDSIDKACYMLRTGGYSFRFKYDPTRNNLSYSNDSNSAHYDSIRFYRLRG